MCGIAGLIVKQSDTLPSDLVNMLKELVHRGRDATGLALYEQRDDIQARVSMTGPAYEKNLLDIVEKYGRDNKFKSLSRGRHIHLLRRVH